MPRGAIAKRSKSPGAAGPPGPSGLGALAFPDIATMAAFPMVTYVDGVESHVLSLDAIWGYDPTSTLAPDVSAAAPLGITVVSANGPGNWLRRDVPSLRWQGQTAWFIDAAAGDDEADGAALTPIATQGEWMRRVDGDPTVPQTVTFTVDSAESPMWWDMRNDSSTGVTVVGGVSAALFSGVVSAVQNWSIVPTPPTDGRITAAGLPVSWTASGLVGKIAYLTGGVHAGKSFWPSADLTGKRARVSEPIDAFSFVHGVFANGDTFDVFNLRALTGEHHVTLQRESSLIFYQLRFGTVAGATHQHDVNEGAPFFLDCALEGFDFQGGSSASCIGCRVREGRTFTGGAALVEAGYMAMGFDVHAPGLLNVSSSYSEGGSIDVDATGVVTLVAGFLAVCDAAAAGFSGLTFGPLAQIDVSTGRLFTIGVTATGLALAAAARCTYDAAPSFVGAAPALAIGGDSRTVAELPWTNPSNYASVVDVTPADQTIDYFDALAADINTVSNVFAAMITRNITVNGTRIVQFDVAWSMTMLAGTQVTVALFIDGVRVAGSGSLFAIIAINSGSVRWRATLAAGAHVITVEWRVQAGQAFCRPVVEEGESCSLTTRELYG